MNILAQEYERLPNNAPVWVKNMVLQELRDAVKLAFGRDITFASPPQRGGSQRRLPGI